MSGASCPGCGARPARGRPFCAACWADVPVGCRRALDTAQRDVARHPTSTAALEAFNEAIAAAASWCDAPTAGAGP